MDFILGTQNWGRTRTSVLPTANQRIVEIALVAGF